MLFSSQHCATAELNTNIAPKYSVLSINVFIIYIFIEHIYAASLNFVIATVDKQLDHKT